MNKPTAIALALASLLAAAARAEYVLKWTLPVYQDPFKDNRVGCTDTTPWDVNKDCVEGYVDDNFLNGRDEFVAMAGVTDTPVRCIPSPDSHAKSCSSISAVTNLDGSGGKELVALFKRPRDQPYGGCKVSSYFSIYDCASRAWVFSAPETSAGCCTEAGPCADMDGEGLSEIAWYTNSDTLALHQGTNTEVSTIISPSGACSTYKTAVETDTYGSPTGICRIYGWHKPGSPEPDTSSKPDLPYYFPLGHSFPSTNEHER